MVKPKKYLGQHFLRDKNIAEKIVNALRCENIDNILEIGAGTGILTSFLLKKGINIHVVEIDGESVSFLKKHFPEIKNTLYEEDFLKFDFSKYFNADISVTGNFPYNISTQIVFKLLENRGVVKEAVGMFQKEVAERITSLPGNKTYGILSVLTQAFYETEYLFTVNENVFYPPPKVKSGVIRLERKKNFNLGCDESLFFKTVKTSFNQRRKTLRNSLKSMTKGIETSDDIFGFRPEQLGVSGFVHLTNILSKNQNG